MMINQCPETADVRCGVRFPPYFYNNISAPHLHLENLDKDERKLDGCIHNEMTVQLSVALKTKPQRYVGLIAGCSTGS